MPRYWLMKSEPGVYSMADLVRDGRTSWEGVRNYQARNFMRDDMKKSDLVLFYHSNAKPPGVAGVARVCREAYPDPLAFDPDSKYFDDASSPDDPRWFMVDLEPVKQWKDIVPLEALKADPQLEGMLVTKKGQRLSVQPVDKPHFDRVKQLGTVRR